MKLIAAAIHFGCESEKLAEWRLPERHSIPLIVNGATLKGSIIDPAVSAWCTEHLVHFKIIAINGGYELHTTEDDMFLAKLKLI